MFLSPEYNFSLRALTMSSSNISTHSFTHSLHMDVFLAPTIILVTSLRLLLQNEHIKASSDIIDCL